MVYPQPNTALNPSSPEYKKYKNEYILNTILVNIICICILSFGIYLLIENDGNNGVITLGSIFVICGLAISIVVTAMMMRGWNNCKKDKKDCPIKK